MWFLPQVTILGHLEVFHRAGDNPGRWHLRPLPEFQRVAADRAEPQVVNVEYPAVFSLDYLRPQVRPEIAPLSVPIGLTERLPS